MAPSKVGLNVLTFFIHRPIDFGKKNDLLGLDSRGKSNFRVNVRWGEVYQRVVYQGAVYLTLQFLLCV